LSASDTTAATMTAAGGRPSGGRPAVVVTSRSFGSGDADPAAELRAAGFEVLRGDPAHTPGALAHPLAAAVGWIAGAAPVRAEHLALAPRLRVLARFGTGTDAVDLGAAAERGVVVARTPGANAESVADHAVALMLAALRHVVAADRAAREGEWAAPARGRELGALTVGIVGFGAVGRGVARRVGDGFGARVLAHDPFVDDATVALDELLARADVISLHCPGGDAPLIDEAALAQVRRGAVLVNTARGSLLDEQAVAEALRDGRLGALAADVLASEPAAASPLLHAPNVTITPHVSAQTTQAIDRMGAESAAEVLRVLRGEPARNPVSA
jgi:D-3-phosphoglycerate dehydrogenase / 2-oxoglutarate reductase